jgi:hypothetical protein
VRFRALIGLLLAALLLGGDALMPLSSEASWSPPTTVWLSDAGHTIDGLFLTAWRNQPELLGKPISEESQATVTLNGKSVKNVTVQYFENGALAYTPNDSRGSDWKVQALELGAATLKADQSNPRFVKLAGTGSCGKLASAECHAFKETEHTVKWGFLDYWNTHGGEQLIGRPLTEEFVSDDGWTVQYFERTVLRWKKDKGVSPRAIGTEAAKAAKIKTAKIAQPDGVPVYDESLFVEPEADYGVGGMDLGYGPGPQQGGYKEIVVSISQEAMWAYEDGELVISSLVSTGVARSPESSTPVGSFSILTKYESQTMSGVIDDEEYYVPDVPWVMYFDNLGNALHGTYWHNNFGHPMSHGCVNQPMDVAEFMYGWAPIGTPVTVLP